MKFKYSIASHPTKYNGVEFRSRLEAKWACFFDLAGLKWEYEPVDIEGWTPDFRLTLPCGHSECRLRACHVLLVEVKPFDRIEEFLEYGCKDFPYGAMYKSGEGYREKQIPADASAWFGNDPSVTYWEMSHGSGGGVESIRDWVMGDIEAMWKQACNQTQWKPPGRP